MDKDIANKAQVLEQQRLDQERERQNEITRKNYRPGLAQRALAAFDRGRVISDGTLL